MTRRIIIEKCDGRGGLGDLGGGWVFLFRSLQLPIVLEAKKQSADASRTACVVKDHRPTMGGRRGLTTM